MTPYVNKHKQRKQDVLAQTNQNARTHRYDNKTKMMNNTDPTTKPE